MSILANTYPTSGNGSMQLTYPGAAAAAATATRLRRVLRSWLQRHFTLTDTRLDDMTLATYEALANAVEHAYRHDRCPRTVDLAARYEPVADVLTVTVTDYGRWHIPVPDPRHIRGRGVPLIRALTDIARIRGTVTGTMVTLQWTNLRPPLVFFPGSPAEASRVVPRHRATRHAAAAVVRLCPERRSLCGTDETSPRLTV